jgi:nicotinamide mononucleotide transporter
MYNWLSDNYIEIFGAITGIVYVIFEIRQNIWLWPLGIITSGIYIWVFFASKLYADMSLQSYYLVISILGWYWWARRKNGREGEGERSTFAKATMDEGESGRGERENRRKGVREKGRNGEFEKNETLHVTRIKLKTGITLAGVFVLLFFAMVFLLSRFTDSPVPGWDSFLTSLSIIATWMLARKIYEHWFLWIVVNVVSMVLYFTRGLYPTLVLYAVYAFMSFIGLFAWKRSIQDETPVSVENS